MQKPRGIPAGLFVFVTPVVLSRSWRRYYSESTGLPKKEQIPMRRIFAALLGLLIGYPLFAFAGYWAIALFSSNGFDRSVEASMTAVFAIGPAGAVVGLIAGLIFGGWKRRAAAPLARSDKNV
jgi:hypothetical protein